VLTVLRSVIRRDLLLAMRRRSDVATVLVFFVIVVSLFPLGVGPEPEMLRTIAPGEQMAVGPTPLGLVVAAKVTAHWLVSGLPLVLLAPVLALQFDLAQSLLGVLTLSLLIGTPVLSLIGAIGAALTLGARGAGALLALLVLPLYAPVLIMGAGAVETAASGLDHGAHLLVLGALLVLAAVFAPWAVAAALRIALE
jgi:heme exporter protein B